MTSTPIAPNGPTVKSAIIAGISLKSIVRYGGKNGNGNFKNMSKKATALHRRNE